MPRDTERRKRFKVAMALLDETQADFARNHGVTPTHLNEVLVGRRKSPRLDALIDDAIARGEALWPGPSNSPPPEQEPQASAA